MLKHFHDGGRYHIETSPWTGFYMITASVMKELTRICHQGRIIMHRSLLNITKQETYKVLKHGFTETVQIFSAKIIV